MSSSRSTFDTTSTGARPDTYNNSRSSGNYNRDADYDSRHHGRWSASGEARDFESRNRSHSSSDLKDRDYDRDYDRHNNFNRGVGGFGSHMGSGYGSGLGSSYGPHNGGYSGYDFGSSAYGHPSTGFGSHMGSGFGTHGLGYDHMGSGFGSSYGAYPHHTSSFGHPGYTSGYGSSYPSSYGSSSSFGHPGFSGLTHPTLGGSLPHYGATHPYPIGHPSYIAPGFGSSAFGSHPFGHQSYGPQAYGSSRGLGGSGSFMNQSTPDVDIYELGNDYIIEVDLPGHSQDHVKSEINGNELLISSKPPSRKHDFHINERSLGHHDVHRKLYLPRDANAQAINATLTNGVLRVVIPRTQATVLPTTGINTSSVITPTATIVKDTTTTTTETRRV